MNFQFLHALLYIPQGIVLFNFLINPLTKNNLEDMIWPHSAENAFKSYLLTRKGSFSQKLALKKGTVIKVP